MKSVKRISETFLALLSLTLFQTARAFLLPPPIASSRTMTPRSLTSVKPRLSMKHLQMSSTSNSAANATNEHDHVSLRDRLRTVTGFSLQRFSRNTSWPYRHFLDDTLCQCSCHDFFFCTKYHEDCSKCLSIMGTSCSYCHCATVVALTLAHYIILASTVSILSSTISSNVLCSSHYDSWVSGTLCQGTTSGARTPCGIMEECHSSGRRSPTRWILACPRKW